MMRMRVFLCALAVAGFLFASRLYAGSEDGLSPDRMLRIGFSKSYFSDVGVRDAKAAIEVWAKEVVGTAVAHYTPSAVVFSTLRSMENAIRNGEVEMITLRSPDYLRIKDKVALEPVAIATVTETVGDEYVLLVHRDRDITGIGQLKDGAVFMQKMGQSSVARMWLDILLMKEGFFEKAPFFVRIEEVKKESQGVLKVFFKQAVACVVRRSTYDTMSELNPQIREQLTVLMRSPRYATDVFCFTNSLHGTDREHLKKACLRLERFPTGRQILTLFKQGRVLPFKSSYLESVEELFREYQDIKARLGETRP
ncbi:MAG: PhnD/SsuA/transferrin family substrate-binding protein [Candidatus Latescibacteria bacterium]|nr:PhnD/SsuA/transferrin family substrate-binding protein [Candidatus Latescibacterota bacterium]